MSPVVRSQFHLILAITYLTLSWRWGRLDYDFHCQQSIISSNSIIGVSPDIGRNLTYLTEVGYKTRTCVSSVIFFVCLFVAWVAWVALGCIDDVVVIQNNYCYMRALEWDKSPQKCSGRKEKRKIILQKNPTKKNYKQIQTKKLKTKTNKVKGPEGPPARCWAPEGPLNF